MKTLLLLLVIVLCSCSKITVQTQTYYPGKVGEPLRLQETIIITSKIVWMNREMTIEYDPVSKKFIYTRKDNERVTDSIAELSKALATLARLVTVLESNLPK